MEKTALDVDDPIGDGGSGEEGGIRQETVVAEKKATSEEKEMGIGKSGVGSEERKVPEQHETVKEKRKEGQPKQIKEKEPVETS